MTKPIQRYRALRIVGCVEAHRSLYWYLGAEGDTYSVLCSEQLQQQQCYTND